MNMRIIRLILSVSLLSLMLLSGNCSSLHHIKNLNLIIVIIDTLRPDHLGCYGYTGIKTDTIDRIAQEGLLFTEAVCQVPLTFPSHCSIFTGRYPTAHGVRHNGLFKLAQSEQTLAETLEQNGFKTGAFVGTYILNSGFGLEQGFATYNDIEVHMKDAKDMRSAQEIQSAERVAEEVNKEFFAWLETVKDTRFFAWIHYFDPHHPYEPPAHTSKILEGEGYDREVSYSDQCLSDVLEKLRELGLLDTSILLVASDHGEALGEHGEQQHGIFIYDCTVRIPLILRAPGIVKGGSKYTGLFETVDIMPTLLGILKVEIPPSVQGEDFSDEIVSGQHHAGKAESYSESYMSMFEYGYSELKSIRKEGKKYIEAPIPEFYDLAKDPAELTNQYSPSNGECIEMRESLSTLFARISSREADPYQIEQIDDDNVKILKSLGYLSGDYFKRGQLKEGMERPDPKLLFEEENITNHGKALMREGKYDQACEAFGKILEKNPKNYQAMIFMIRSLFAKKDYERALEVSKEVVKIAELDPTAMIALGSEPWNIYGYLLAREDDIEGAKRAFMKGFDLNPNRAIAFKLAADFCIAHKDFDTALEIVQKTIEENEQNVSAHAYLFKLYLEKKNIEDAILTAKKLASFDMSDEVQTLEMAAKMLHRRRVFPEAAIAYEQLLKYDPDNSHAAETLGSMYLASGDVREAEKRFEHALSLDPQQPTVHYYLGIIDLQKSDEASARKRFEKVLFLNPAFYQVHDALGKWLKREGREEEAREEFTKALAINPDDPVAREELGNLR